MEDFKMKRTGIVRKIDDLGRVTLPMELRKTLCRAQQIIPLERSKVYAHIFLVT
jgi:bifunctional DNA-binding transcriptional regulator/antitoxin component of YhaV-PrlF toxin-antitoxin module